MAKKKSKKTFLKQKQVLEIVDERTKHNKLIDVNSGLEVTRDNEKNSYVNSDGLVVNDDMVIEINYNETVRKRITKYAKVLLGMRGIKNLETIDATDRDVDTLVRKWVKRNKDRHITRDEKNQQINISIESVKMVHRPQYMLVMFQLMSWAVLYDSLFTIKGGVAMCEFDDIEIPEDYWTSGLSKKDDVDANLDNLISGFVVPDLRFDRTNPLEIMIAQTSTFLDKYENIGEELQVLFQKIFVAMDIINGDQKFDDAGFLNTRLDELLSKIVDETDDTEE